jgi:hypothetical protein
MVALTDDQLHQQKLFEATMAAKSKEFTDKKAP